MKTKEIIQKNAKNKSYKTIEEALDAKHESAKKFGSVFNIMLSFEDYNGK